MSDPPQNRLHFSQSDHAIDAALASAGGALGRISMAAAHLRDDGLVMPFKTAMRVNAAYRIVCPMGSQTRPQVARFIDWVEEEVGDMRQWEEGLDFLKID